MNNIIKNGIIYKLDLLKPVSHKYCIPVSKDEEDILSYVKHLLFWGGL